MKKKNIHIKCMLMRMMMMITSWKWYGPFNVNVFCLLNIDESNNDNYDDDQNHHERFIFIDYFIFFCRILIDHLMISVWNICCRKKTAPCLITFHALYNMLTFNNYENGHLFDWELKPTANNDDDDDDDELRTGKRKKFSHLSTR